MPGAVFLEDVIRGRVLFYVRVQGRRVASPRVRDLDVAGVGAASVRTGCEREPGRDVA
jgi:hypothetical protein